MELGLNGRNSKIRLVLYSLSFPSYFEIVICIWKNFFQKKNLNFKFWIEKKKKLNGKFFQIFGEIIFL